MWFKLRWRICVWACVVIVSAVAVGKVAQVLSVDGLGDEEVEINVQQPTDEKRSFLNDTLGDQSSDLIWFIQVIYYY